MWPPHARLSRIFFPRRTDRRAIYTTLDRAYAPARMVAIIIENLTKQFGSGDGRTPARSTRFSLNITSGDLFFLLGSLRLRQDHAPTHDRRFYLTHRRQDSL